MSENAKRIWRAIGEFLLLALLVHLAPLAILLDTSIVGSVSTGVPEISFTEISQELLAFSAALMFFHRAARNPGGRGFLVLAGALFLCMLIREHDAMFDQLWDGLWETLVALTAVSAIGFAATRGRNTVVQPMLAFINSRAYYPMLFGLIVVLVFSRVFGSGNLLWEPIMGEAYHHNIKGAIQEGLELFGYLFIAQAAFIFCWLEARGSIPREDADSLDSRRVSAVHSEPSSPVAADDTERVRRTG